MANLRMNIIVSGRVQGVFFRAHAVEVGQRLGLRGWVRNLPTGDVEAEIEGDETAVQHFVAWCQQGSPQSRVDAVRTAIRPSTGEFTDFGVRR